MQERPEGKKVLDAIVIASPVIQQNSFNLFTFN